MDSAAFIISVCMAIGGGIGGFFGIIGRREAQKREKEAQEFDQSGKQVERAWAEVDRVNAEREDERQERAAEREIYQRHIRELTDSLRLVAGAVRSEALKAAAEATIEGEPRGPSRAIESSDH